MSQNHIPAPWTHHSGTGDIYKDGYLIASVRLNSHNIEPEERATAHRIVQCVNALEEIENPTQLVEDYKSMKALLKEMLMIWDRGDSVSANCVYPNAVRFQLGVEPKEAERKKVVEQESIPYDKTINLKINSLIDEVVIINNADTPKKELEAKIVTALENAIKSFKEILESDEYDLKIKALSKVLSSFPPDASPNRAIDPSYKS